MKDVAAEEAEPRGEEQGRESSSFSARCSPLPSSVLRFLRASAVRFGRAHSRPGTAHCSGRDRAELKKLLPSEGRALEVEVEALESDDVARAILQVAERHGVDLLVLGRHGRGPLAAALMGSVARAVSQRSARPVLLVPEAPAAT